MREGGGGRKVFGGLFLIFLGIIFLLNNFGLIGWDVWWTFAQFWPLLLIGLGLRLIFRNNIVIQVIAFLLIFVVPLAYYLGYGNQYSPRWVHNGQTQSHNWVMENDPKLTEANLSLDIDAGRVEVNQGEKLVTLETRTVNGPPDIKYNTGGSRADIGIKQESLKILPFFPDNHSWGEDWQVALGPNVAWNLDIKTGAGNGELDLEKVRITKLKAHTGAGNLTCKFGNIPHTTEADFHTGAGSITLVIPPEVGVKAQVSTGLGSKELGDRGWQQRDNTYISSNYTQAVSKVNLEIHTGAGSITIRTP